MVPLQGSSASFLFNMLSLNQGAYVLSVEVYLGYIAQNMKEEEKGYFFKLLSKVKKYL